MSDTEYLSAGFDINDPDTVAVLDELSLWSARIGTLLLDHIPFSRGMNVLDVGCGIGFPCLELAQQLGSSCYVVGIDPWKAGLKRMNEKLNALASKRGEIRLTIPIASVEAVKS